MLKHLIPAGDAGAATGPKAAKRSRAEAKDVSGSVPAGSPAPRGGAGAGAGRGAGAAGAADLAAERARLVALWPALQPKLAAKLKAGDAATVRAMADLFPASRYPAKVEEQHCVYCHEHFDPRLNKAGACVLAHQCKRHMQGDTGSDYDSEPDYRGKDQFRKYVWTQSCFRCNHSQTFRSYDDEEMGHGKFKGQCRKGRHCSDREDRLKRGWPEDFEEHWDPELEGCRDCMAAAKKSAAGGTA